MYPRIFRILEEKDKQSEEYTNAALKFFESGGVPPAWSDKNGRYRKRLKKILAEIGKGKDSRELGIRIMNLLERIEETEDRGHKK